ncbi:D-amino acid dehydrogenase [Oceanospirillum linum]|uniref:FAD dependent oxidoreductase domain-containing protein n=1 Tax=Oceanospirillum linum TaxID=966 RepID=A0A1T1HDG8_OCELI|nr:D-amino acid dehydrogenase [Oceanospirillum linum]OOV87909.1 hypothetical protein BTA35_0207940 [Oceanospirillum linum]SEG50918.1 D-amino-acid dehydrogenase [Oleiphilus messinensis]SMP35305.1 D-amino-acid dehydrogenase [Oceanospirillum linum]
MYDSIVLGSGVIGVNTAYWLAKAGHKVLVIDRQPIPGNETSYANGGQIAVSHADPWAKPSAPLSVIKDLIRDDAPLLFRPGMDIRQWRWLLSWFGQCTPGRWRTNLLEAMRLSAYSQELTRQVQNEHQLKYQQIRKGVLHLYRTDRSLNSAKQSIEQMRNFGLNRKIISPEEALTQEPALRFSNEKIVGATYTESDESGDAREYCQQLADVCREMGVTFAMNTHIMQLVREGRRIHVRVNGELGNQHLTANHLIVCMGPWSARLLKPLNVWPNIYPVKGYSISVPLEYPEKAPTVSLTDETNKLVFSRLGDELRVAGTGELGGYSRELNVKRCDRILEQARRLFPEAGGFDQARFWTGLRPATPSGLPCIRKTRFDNLWINSGHNIGWTMGCGSGKYLADLISNGSATEFDHYELPGHLL